MNWHLEKKDQVFFLTLNCLDQKVNTLSTPVMTELKNILNHIKTQEANVLVIQSEKSGFIAGADIKEIESITTEKEAFEKAMMGQDVFTLLSTLPFVTVAAINGVCLGGGLELALSCDFRVIADDPKIQIGLPEVNLGIIPGFGGTQRLPRLIGLLNALPLILTGKLINPDKAMKLHLVDACFSSTFFSSQLAGFIQKIQDLNFRKALIKKRHQRSVISKAFDLFWPLRTWALSRAKKEALKKSQYPAPLQAIKAIGYGMGAPLYKGLLNEATLFSTLSTTLVSKNLIQLFYQQESLKKYTGDISQDLQGLPIHFAGVLGAGLMGGGISWLLADQGVFVRMKDLSEKALSLGYSQAKKNYDELLKKKKRTVSEANQGLIRIRSGLNNRGLQKADLIIEAVLEDLAVKQSVFKELESVISRKAILASNTSSLSIDKMASVLQYPDRFLGMHFFSPVHKMPLVEIIPGQHTSKQNILTLIELSKRLKKTPIVVSNCPGFLVNRILIPYVNEAIFLLEEGVSIERIDRLMVRFGMPVGPLLLADEVGLDVGYKVAKVLQEGYPSRMGIPDSFKAIMALPELRGKKTGQGFYSHTNKEKKANPYMMNLMKRKGTQISDEDIVNRMVLLMVNEAARCLEENVVASPSLLDMAMILGTGFPPFHGGLCRYADTLGISNVVSVLTQFQSQYASRFSPAPLLLDMVASKKKFFNA